MWRLTPVLVLALTVTGCGALTGTGRGDGPRAAADGRVSVAASFYPLAFVAQAVGGRYADVEDLTAPGQEPHDLELSVEQTADVASAQLVVYEAALAPAVTAAVRENATGQTLDVATVAGLEPFGHDGHDDSARGDSEGEAHGTSETDPHFWQDPLKLARVVGAVEQRLVAIDPDHAAAYRRNAAALTARLRQLDAGYATGLAGCRQRTIVVSHDAFGYLTRYGLDIEPIAGLSPDAEPTPADLARLEQLIRREHITTVFTETLVSPRLSRTLADDTGVRTAVLDPIEGLTKQTADQDYLSLMRANLAAIEKANGC